MNDEIQKLIKPIKTKISTLKPVRKRLIKAEFALSMFHEPTLRSTEFWTQGPKDTALARGVLIVSARVDPVDGESANEGIVRQYDLGLAPRIKDTRTGRVTTRVQQVLKGELETLLDA